MAKASFWDSISVFDTSVSLAEKAIRVITFFVIAGGGTLSGLLAKADPVLSELGSIYWVSIGLLTSLILMFILYLFNLSRLKQAEAEFTLAMSVTPNNINPLLDSFSDVVIPIEDLRLPMLQLHKNKQFKRCKFVGPGAIAILGGSYENCGFHECGDIIAMPEGVFMTGIVVLQNCTVENCEFMRTTILTDQRSAQGFSQIPGASVKGLINQ